MTVLQLGVEKSFLTVQKCQQIWEILFKNLKSDPPPQGNKILEILATPLIIGYATDYKGSIILLFISFRQDFLHTGHICIIEG